MSERSGLDRVDLAVLDALDLLGADGEGEPVRCSEVLAVVAAREHVDPAEAWDVLVDLALPRRVHLPLVELYVAGPDPSRPRAAESAEARLTPVGTLGLAAERGDVGPVPLGLVEGSLHRGGQAPPFAPEAVVGALLAGSDGAGRPTLPGGGTVEGDVDGLLAGRPARLRIRSTVRAEGGDLVLTELPFGVAAYDVVAAVNTRVEAERSSSRSALRLGRRCPVVEARDESTALDGTRVHVDVDRGVDLRDARDWLLGTEPVTVEVDCRLPAPMSELLSGWDRGDGSGLRALAELLRDRPPAA